MSVEYGHSEEETNALIGAYVRQIIREWKEELRLSEELLSHTAAMGDFYNEHKGRQGFLRHNIAFYESMLVANGYDTEEKPATSEGF